MRDRISTGKVIISRRSVLTSLLAAPVVIKSASLMAIRGVIMPIRDFMWGKQTVMGGDYQLGLEALEDIARPIPFGEYDGTWQRPTLAEESILDNLHSLVAGHRDGEAFLSRGMIDFPLGFRRIANRHGNAAYIDES